VQPLRARWATALGTFADQYQAAGQWDRAISAYRKALELLAAARRWRRFAPNDPRLRDLIAELETGSPPR
jgi:hypothetical protein